MERRLKILMVSMTVCREWDKNYPRMFAEALEAHLPGAVVIQQWDEKERATVSYSVYHKSFPIVKDGRELQRINIPIPKKSQAKQSSSVIGYPH